MTLIGKIKLPCRFCGLSFDVTLEPGSSRLLAKYPERRNGNAFHGDGQGHEEFRVRQDAIRRVARSDGAIQRGVGEGWRDARWERATAELEGGAHPVLGR